MSINTFRGYSSIHDIINYRGEGKNPYQEIERVFFANRYKQVDHQPPSDYEVVQNFISKLSDKHCFKKAILSKYKDNHQLITEWIVGVWSRGGSLEPYGINYSKLEISLEDKNRLYEAYINIQDRRRGYKISN